MPRNTRSSFKFYFQHETLNEKTKRIALQEIVAELIKNPSNKITKRSLEKEFNLSVSSQIYKAAIKQCSKCKNKKPRTSEFFNKAYTNADSLSSWCKICLSKKVCDYVINLKSNPELYKKRSLYLSLRTRLNEAFKKYSITGKKQQSSRKYGINWQAIINYLGPCPGDRKDYHIDHIIPLCAFNFNDPIQVRAAFAPENHQWLKIEDNLSKNGKYSQKELKAYLKKFK